MSDHHFCSETALERGEPLAGTGALPERMLLIRWPRGQWRRSRSAAGMTPELEAAMQAVNAASPFGLFVDRADGALPRLHAFPENVALDAPGDAELAAAMRHWAAGNRLAGRHEPRLTIICCTDGRTDACCARFGFATYKALLAAADPRRFNVMQCNHLGGCRFATSLVVATRRERYGRLQPDEVPAFLAAIGKGDVYLPRFRGRADLDEPRQVAEVVAMGWAAEAGLAPAAAVLSEPVAAGPRQLAIEAGVGGRQLLIRLLQRDISRPGSCRSEESAVARWTVQALEPRL